MACWRVPGPGAEAGKKNALFRVQAAHKNIPVLTTLKWFRPEFEAYVKGKPPAPADYRARKPVGTH